MDEETDLALLVRVLDNVIGIMTDQNHTRINISSKQTSLGNV